MTHAASYREIGLSTEVIGADPVGLMAILYRELVDTLRLASAMPRLADRALTILAQIESSMDREGEAGGPVRRVHAQVWRLIQRASQENDPIRIQQAIETIEPIADAWSSLRTRS